MNDNHYAIKLLRLLEEQKEEIKDLKANCKKLDRENQALYESINLEDDNMLSRMYQEQKQRIKELEQINEEHKKLNGTLREEINELKKEKEDILDYIEE